MKSILFDGWFDLLRASMIAITAYIVLVVFLRASGKRTLSKMNAFDLVITVALGSTLATVVLNRDVSLAEGALAFALLVGLQFVVTWSSVRAGWVRRLVKSDRTLLFYDGQFLDSALVQQRVTREEVLAAIRGAGVASLGSLRAVVLETDGTISVVPRTEANASALSNVSGAE